MIENSLNYINHYLQTHVYLGGLFTFIIAFAESLPIIGTILPGSIIMSVIGILVGRGMLPFSTILWLASAGAFLGDTIGFWIGKHYNERLRYMWPFKKHPKWLTMSEAFFAKHGGKSILIGRFVGPARSSVPLIAGLLKMSWPRFIVAAVPSAILWAIVYMLPGVLIGAISLELPRGTTTKFMLIALAILVFLWLLFWAIQRFFVFLAGMISHLIDKLWLWLSRHHSSKFLIRSITVKDHPEDHYQLTLLLLCLLSFVAFILVLVNVVTLGPLTDFNDSLFNFLQSIRNAHSDKFFIIMTFLGQNSVIAVFSILVAMGFAVKKQWRAAIHLLILLFLALGSGYFFKWLVYSPRPMGFMVIDSTSSFPSGHTLMSLTLLGFMAFLTARQLDKVWHWIPYTLVSIFVFLVAFSRIYLGAHWLTDTLGSIFLGFTLLLLAIISFRRRTTSLVGSHWWMIFLVGALALPWAAYWHGHFRPTTLKFTHSWPTQDVGLSDWWNQPHEYLPVYRVNRFGEPMQPFNVQWADTLTNIKTVLTKEGWEIIKTQSGMRPALRRFSSNRPEQHFPLFQPLYRQQPPVLFFIKHLPNTDTIMELRLWQSGVQLSHNDIPLWIGTINYHATPAGKHSVITLLESAHLNQLIKSLSRHYQYKLIQIPTQNQPTKVQPLKWDGSIIIIRPR